MVDFDRKSSTTTASDMPSKSPKVSGDRKLAIQPPPSPGSSPDEEAARVAYEYYLGLPELRMLWSSRDFPEWNNEPILKPALQGLEITFRLISLALWDPRPYANTREWTRRLQRLVTSQIQLVAAVSEEDDDSAPTTAAGIITKVRSDPGYSRSTTSVSLLQKLATWRRSEDVAQKMMLVIEGEMRRCRYTLGIGEPNLAGKPNLQYDAVCRTKDVHGLKKNPYSHHVDNYENQILCTTHQILESWIYASLNLIKRINSRIEEGKFEKASMDVYLLERIWKLLAEIEDLHFLMDPADFLDLKNQLQIKSTSSTEAICFRSTGLVEMTKMSKDLRHKVPSVLAVEPDPSGGPRVQATAMKLYHQKREFEKIHLLQGLQAVEAALKRFFFAYRQVTAAMMGTVEANAHGSVVSHESRDSLAEIFLEPTYYPSLDGAKTFLGYFSSHRSPERESMEFSRQN